MRIAAARVRPYRLPLRSPLVTSAGTVEERQGVVVTIEDEGGLTGMGEAAPPDWLGGDTTACVEGMLRCLFDDWAAARWDGNEMLSAAEACGSQAARCAVETAILDLRAKRRGITLAALLIEECQREGRDDSCGPRVSFTRDLPAALPAAALCLARDPDELAAEIGGLRVLGFNTFKIKVGSPRPAADVSRVRAAQEAAGPTATLRLDANQAWTIGAAMTVLSEVAPGAVEYVEEPLAHADPGALRGLRERIGLPIALDESVSSRSDLEPFVAGNACDVVILKLARMGGPRGALATGLYAISRGLDVVLTDSLETCVGRAAAVHTAAALATWIRHREREEEGRTSGDARVGVARLRALGLGGAVVLARDLSGDGPPVRQPSVSVSGPGLGL